MRKKTFAILILLLSLLNLDAQNNRWSVEIGAGAALPVGKFASKNIYDSTASFAKIGPALNLALNYRFSSYFSTTILLSGQQNNVDTKNIDKKWDAASPGNYYQTTSNNWLIGKLMAGITANLPVNKRLFLSGRVTAGAVKTSTYKFTTIGYTAINDSLNLGPGSSPTTITETNAKQALKWEFTYLIGTGIKYSLTKQVLFLCNLDYSSSTLRFARIYYSNLSTGVLTGSGNPPPQAIRALPKQPVSSLNLSVGLAVNL